MLHDYFASATTRMARRQGRRATLALAALATAAGLALAACGGSTPPAASQSHQTSPAQASPSQAQPTGWRLVAKTAIPIFYYQGMTQDDSGHFFFDGIDNGLYVTNSQFQQQAGTTPYIPAAVAARDKYNHIGAITYDKKLGVLLPMECYDSAKDTNCANTGAIGVAAPDSLAWQYEVKLDPSAIKKAMWAAVSPDGTLLWTSSGNDLLAYRTSDLTAAHAWPAHPAIQAVRVLHDAVPPSGVTGGTFYQGRLLVAGSQGNDQQVWSIDLADGSRHLAISQQVVGESEGLDVFDGGAAHAVPACDQDACAAANGKPGNTFGGVLHWMIMPQPLGSPTVTYPEPIILSFAPEN